MMGFLFGFLTLPNSREIPCSFKIGSSLRERKPVAPSTFTEHEGWRKKDVVDIRPERNELAVSSGIRVPVVNEEKPSRAKKIFCSFLLTTSAEKSCPGPVGRDVEVCSRNYFGIFLIELHNSQPSVNIFIASALLIE